jgi:hypothetical protein
VDRVQGPAAGLKVPDAIADEAAHRFQLASPGRTLLPMPDARSKRRRPTSVISLTTDTGARGYLERRRARLPDKADESHS